MIKFKMKLNYKNIIMRNQMIDWLLENISKTSKLCDYNCWDINDTKWHMLIEFPSEKSMESITTINFADINDEIFFLIAFDLSGIGQ